MKNAFLIAAIVLFTSVEPARACGQSACAYGARAATYKGALLVSSVLVGAVLATNAVIAFSTMNLSSEFSAAALKNVADTVSKLSIAVSVVQGVALLPSAMLAIGAFSRDRFAQLHQGDGAACVRFSEYLLATDLLVSGGLWAGMGVLVAQLMSSQTVARLIYPLWLSSTIMTGVSFLTSVCVVVFGHLLRRYGTEAPRVAIKVEVLEMN